MFGPFHTVTNWPHGLQPNFMGLVFLIGRDTFRYTCTDGSSVLYSDLESIKKNNIKTLHLRLGHSTDV